MTPTLHDTVQRYLKRCAATQRRPTVELKSLHLRCVMRFLHAQHPHVHSWDALRRHHVEGWLESMAQTTLRPNTRAHRILDLRTFARDLTAWRWPEAPAPDLIRDDDFPPAEYTLPKPLPPDIDTAVRDALARRRSLTAMGLLLLRQTGMRIGEMLDLELHALQEAQPDACALRVPMGKTYSERMIPVGEPTVQLIHAIQAQRGQMLRDQPIPAALAHFLMLDPHGRRLARNTYSGALKRFTRNIPTSESIHPHRLRHSFATEMIRAGMSIQALMKILGHQEADMTLRYVQIATTDLAREYHRALANLSTLRNLQLPDIVLPPPSAPGLQHLIALLISAVDCLQRDLPDDHRAAQLQRFAKRIRRARDDLNALLQQTVAP